MFVSFAFAALVPSVWGICESECEDVTRLLSECSLPPISAVWDWGNVDPTIRNVSGLPDSSPYTLEAGPVTLHIANYSQAQCFCTDARLAAPYCESCLVFNAADNFTRPLQVNQIGEECEAFGYYDDSNFSYPSTTLSDMPQRTSVLDLEPIREACYDTCAVIHGQIDDCGLTQLDSEWPQRVDIDEHRRARLLLNRTSAECICTLPVLRHSIACKYCLRVTDDDSNDLIPRAWERVGDYMLECHQMGYWTDNQFATPNFALDNPTITYPASPSPTEDAAVGAIRPVGLMTAAFLCAIWLLQVDLNL